MIKIIKKGIKPNYKIICWRCNTEFVYDKKDIHIQDCVADSIKCPVCKEILISDLYKK